MGQAPSMSACACSGQRAPGLPSLLLVLSSRPPELGVLNTRGLPHWLVLSLEGSGLANICPRHTGLEWHPVL